MKKFKKFSCGCNEHIEDDYGDVKSDQLFLPPNKKFELKIDYPLSHPARIIIHTGKNGMRYMALVKQIKKAYAKIYEEEDNGTDDGRYGIYGHDIGDLTLEGIDIDFEKERIEISVGS